MATTNNIFNKNVYYQMQDLLRQREKARKHNKVLLWHKGKVCGMVTKGFMTK